ncbi:hypothetical protein ACI0FM_12170 [Paenochrobactrum sp. BZR 588]|uniref:hypothetical protein n=1 Tax=unclassified Paenochrobactrum TaxID=2639760 RepID=UPI003853F6B3
MNKQNTGKAQQADKAKPEWRGPAIAAACIMFGFAFFGYLLPPIMLWLGEYSLVAAAVFAVIFVLAFFGVFWLRARNQKGL